MRGIVVAGTHSGCGKTTVTLGIMAALRRKGLAVQPFKAGPDFIDAGLHRLAAGRISRNLDLWMCGPEYVRTCFEKHAAAADIAVIEGVMGLYDGDRSTASLAALLNAPVVLVVDAYGMAESAGAVVRGFHEFGMRNAEDPSRSRLGEGGGRGVAGVIFNRVASESHFRRLKESVQDTPVLGYLPRDAGFEIPHRHLGLTTAEEEPITRANSEKLAEVVLAHIDIEAILHSAVVSMTVKNDDGAQSAIRDPQSAIRIAVARDKAFCFYYEDNLDLLRAAGAKIVPFSPLVDRSLPAADMLYLGGGYPELHAAALSRNEAMRNAVRAWAESGRPLYAECGGLMYLSRAITKDGTAWPMAGVFPFATRMLGRPKLGYREAVLRENVLLGRAGDVRRGHEFHYSEIVGGVQGSSYRVSDSTGAGLPDEGYRYRNTLASYIHLHFGNDPRCAGHIISQIRGDGTA